MTHTQTMLSGIQASGQPSLGNLLGALIPFNQYQNTHNFYVFMADHHAITVRQDPKTFRENTYALAAWYIASGLNPDVCTLFAQSHVPAHTELGWILNSFTQMGELERMTQFKDKSQQHKQNINAGLFTYPALQAADILLYHPHEVPVGEDQRQHIELTRDIATRFNGIYGDTFTVPKAVIPKVAARVKDLQDPTKKMSKSNDSIGTIFLLDNAKTIEKKLKKAVTDTKENVIYDPQNQAGLANLLEIYATLTNTTPQQAAEDMAGPQYGPVKKAVIDAALTTIIPIQEKYQTLMADKAELDNILAKGAAKASLKANQTLLNVKQKMGYTGV